jgi:RNA polymerase sigma-70 factor (ECF subfamily)
MGSPTSTPCSLLARRAASGVNVGCVNTQKKPPRLALIFLAYRRERAVTQDELEEIEELLQQTDETVRAAWPSVVLSDEVFVRHLAKILPELDTECPLPEALRQPLEQSNLAGLYLACACIHNVPGASVTLERDILARLPALLDPKLPPTVVDEICQGVRIHLLVGTGTGPQLALYKGQSSLLSWIRVIAARMGLKRVAPVREMVDDGVLAAIEAMPTFGNDAEIELLKRRCLQEFRAAAREAFSALQDRPRYLLRIHFIDGLSTIELGKLYGVDQSTASRWLKSARQAVYDETKRLLKERLRLSSHEFESILRDIDSRLDMSFGEILKEEEEQALRQVVREVISALPDAQRHLLRLYFIARQSAPEAESVRQMVHEDTKRRFLEKRPTSSQKAGNALGDLSSQIDLILRQLLLEMGKER